MNINKNQFDDIYIKAGTKVKLTKSNDEDNPEYGIVFHCWWNDIHQVYDCYVAYFGDFIPEGKPTEMPYILISASMFLEIIK